MRIFDVTIGGKKYKACCGLRALAVLQKEYGNLQEFEKRLLGKADTESEKATLYPDVNTVINTCKLFLEQGNAAVKGELTEEQIESVLAFADDLYGIATQVYEIYTAGLYSESMEEDGEKNQMSQTMESLTSSGADLSL